MSNTARMYHNPVEKDQLKQNNAIRQLIDVSSKRGGGGVSVIDFGAVGDNTTNNDAAFTKAFTDIAGTVYIPEGTFLLSPTASIAISSAIHCIWGPGTIKCSGGATGTDFWLLSTSHSELEIFGLTFDIDPATFTNGHAIGLFGATDVAIHDCVFLNSGGYALEISNGSSNCGIYNCAFYNFRKTSALIDDGAFHYFTDNKVHCARTNTALHGLYISNTLKATVQGNIIDRSYNFGIYAFNCTNISISDNVMTNSRLDAIRLDGTGGTAQGFVISGNVIDNPNEASEDLGIGVGFGSQDGDVTENGLIAGNFIRSVGNSGIVVQTDGTFNTTTQDITVLGNEIENPSQLAPHANYGIVVGGFSGSILRTVIKDNVIRSSDSNMVRGIIEVVSTGSSVDTTLLLNNVVTGATSSAISLGGPNSVAYAPYLPPSTKTGSFSVDGTADNYIINAGGTTVITMQSASGRWMTGREILIKTVANQAVQSSTTNIVQLASTTASTAILAATAGKWARLKSDGTQWTIMASN